MSKLNFGEEIPSGKIIQWKTIENCSVSLLKHNPLNDRYFNVAEQIIHNASDPLGNKFRQLEASIKTNGIRNPILCVKQGNKYLILSGHRRFVIACKLGFSEVPIRYANESDLNEYMQEFILIDENMTSRSINSSTIGAERYNKLSAARLKLYFKMVPGLESRLTIESKGKAGTKNGGVTASFISDETGIPVHKVQKDLSRLRNMATRKVSKIKAQENGIDVERLASLRGALASVMANVNKMDRKTKKEAKDYIGKWIKRVMGI